MNENTKKYFGIVVGVISLLAVAWFMLSDVHSDRGTADDVRTELDAAAAEQREAADTLGRVESGLGDSERTAAGIGESVGRAQSSAGRIAESDRAAAAAVGRAQSRNAECREITRDSERRLGECQQVVQAVRAAAREN